MRLTDEQVMQDNKRFANCNALAELKYCGWDIPHRKSITNDEIHFYAWLCRSAVALLKEQEAKTGYWIESAGDDKCSVCGATYSDLYPDYQHTHYCPNCGAKMIEQAVKRE